MKVLTFNIQHGVLYLDKEKRIDLAGAAELINKYQPDVVSLNEIRGLGELSQGAQLKEPRRLDVGETTAEYSDQTAVLASLTGMNGVFSPAISIGEGILYGNALLTKLNIIETEIIQIPSPDADDRFYDIGVGYESRCLLRAKLGGDNGEITALVCHMGLPTDQRLDAVKAVCRTADAIEGRKLLMGDFNMTPETELLAPIRMRFDDTAEFGADGATFPSDSPDRKIDYIFTSGMTIENAEVLPDIVSDHRAISADLK